MQENTLLRFIAQHAAGNAEVVLPVGDDMAALRCSGLALLKIDQCLDTVHFDSGRHTAEQIARKAVNRCLSDCAAMACLPAAVLLAVTLPKTGPAATEEFAEALFLAARAAANVYDAPIVGGDTAAWNGPLALTVAALGKNPPEASDRLITRAGARPGDVIFVSGALGGSLQPDLSGRHLSFTPRIHLARALARVAGPRLHAMMDLSDGLAQDLPRLCHASGVGAELHAANLPIHEDAHALAAHDHLPAGLHALIDGEDYELLFALDPEATPDIVNLADIPLTAIGTFARDPALHLIDAEGRRHPFPKAGFQHMTDG